MIEKFLFDKILSRLSHGGLEVVYWDGDKRHYGPDAPTVTITFDSPKVARAILNSMSLGFGENYAAGHLQVDGSLIEVGRLVNQNTDAFKNLKLTNVVQKLQRNIPRNQKKFIQHHYDIGNDFYKLWLDKQMLYSCAYFRNPKTDNLEKAQSQKLDHLLKKLQLQPGQKLLDIGSGWGSLLIRAAEKDGVTGLGITLSKEQLKRSRQAAKEAGVTKQISFELRNYQDLMREGQKFDRIISVGMFEHVGRGNHAAYYKAIKTMLVDGGISVLHTITSQIEEPNDPWIDKYIFPGGYIPSTREIVSALPDYDLHLIDYENLRLHYALTLEEWQRRFHKHHKEVVNMYDESFYRTWDLWLAFSAAAFRYGHLNLSQFVLTKGLNNDLPLTREFLYK